MSDPIDANLWRFQIWRFLFWPALRQLNFPLCDAPPPENFSFDLDSLTPPPPPNFVEKPGSICQGLQLVEYSSNQTLTYIGVTRKKLSSFCLQWTTCITLENEARNCNTSIRSQMILEFWNIWHSNLSFLWAFWSKLLLSGSFGHLYRES